MPGLRAISRATAERFGRLRDAFLSGSSTWRGGAFGVGSKASGVILAGKLGSVRRRAHADF